MLVGTNGKLVDASRASGFLSLVSETFENWIGTLRISLNWPDDPPELASTNLPYQPIG